MNNKEIVSKIKEKLEEIDSLLEKLSEDTDLDCGEIAAEIAGELNSYGEDLIDDYDINISRRNVDFNSVTFDKSTIEDAVERIIRKHIKNK